MNAMITIIPQLLLSLRRKLREGTHARQNETCFFALAYSYLCK